jgi:membrane-associated phospholipid phosphatase
VSGHAFIGAVPFITAAQMTDKIWAKGLFYTLSTIPGWSRVNDNAHYLSQVLLGWYLGYLSVRSVSATEGLKPLPRGLTIFPIADGNAVGMGLIYRR